MQYQKIIETFFRKYGSLITSEDETEQVKGIIAPVRDLATELEHITYSKVGFVPKKEYLFLTPAEDTVVQKHHIVKADGKKFKIVESDYYYLSDTPFYRRSYAYEVKELC